jgi:hypothetical protein
MGRTGNRSEARRWIGATAAYFLFLHTLLVGFVTAEAAFHVGAEPGLPQLCLNGGGGADTPGDSGAAKGDPAHCTLCATHVLAGAAAVNFRPAPKALAIDAPALPGLLAVWSGNWSTARAPPRG